VKISRTLLFLANLARAIPVNPLMLIDTTHHAAERDVTREVAAGHPAPPVPADDRIVEARAAENSGSSRARRGSSGVV
jgi:hypothetical protein